MSLTLLDELRTLAAQEDWDAIVALSEATRNMKGPNADRALGVHILGRAHWNRLQDPWDITAAIRYAREACRLDPLGGEAPLKLGIRLVTIGRFREGRRILQAWIARLNEWAPAVRGQLADVDYTLGYAARYEGDLAAADLWYWSARERYLAAGNAEWASLTTCALVQVLARKGDTAGARMLLDQVPAGECEAYRLKAAAELLAAEGDTEAALATGELASEHLTELDDPDPWELSELHLLLANLQFQAGDHLSGHMHAELALDAMRSSPRHDLYRAACLLLDYEPGSEVIA